MGSRMSASLSSSVLFKKYFKNSCVHFSVISDCLKFWSTYFESDGGDKLCSPPLLELWVYFFLPSVVHIHQQLP